MIQVTREETLFFLNQNRLEDLLDAESTAIEFMLQHRLFLSYRMERLFTPAFLNWPTQGDGDMTSFAQWITSGMHRYLLTNG